MAWPSKKKPRLSLDKKKPRVYREFVLLQLSCQPTMCVQQISNLNLPAIQVFAELQQAKKLL